MQNASKTISNIYIIALFTLGVFYMEHKYADLSQAKMHITMIISVGYLLLMFGCMLLGKATKEKAIKRIEKFDLLDTMIVGFAASNLLSTICSKYAKQTMLGLSEWQMGSLIIICLALVYITLSRNFQYSHNIWLPIMAVFGIESIWTLMQFMGKDPFSLHLGMTSKKLNYIGSIGNVNWYVAYLVILLAVCMHFSLSATDKTSKIIYALFFYLAYLCVFLCHSDSVYLSLAVIVIIESVYLLQKPDAIKAFLMQGIYASMSALTVSFLPRKYAKIIDGISRFLIKKHIVLYIGMICLVLIILLKKYPIKHIPRWFHYVFYTVLTLSLVGAAGYLCANFTESFGTNRGLIWQLAIDYYKKFTVWEKIIGTGPDSVVVLMSNEAIGGRYISGVHCEYLQNLLCLGWLGFLQYCGIYLSVILAFIRNKEKSEQTVALFLAIMAYGMQALVNNAQVLHIAMLFVMLAVFQNEIKNLKVGDYNEF